MDRTPSYVHEHPLTPKKKFGKDGTERESKRHRGNGESARRRAQLNPPPIHAPSPASQPSGILGSQPQPFDFVTTSRTASCDGRDLTAIDTTILKLCGEVIRVSKLMNSSGLNEGTSGNVSVRVPGGFLITPSGMPYEKLVPNDIVFVDDGGGYYGNLLPSSEWRLHYDIYISKPSAEAVVHAHPDHCTALSALHDPIPAFHYMIGVAGGKEIPCARYETFGSQALSDSVLDALGDSTRACLMANHGMICFNSSLDKAFGLAKSVEQLARQYIIARQIGNPKILDDNEMDNILAKFKTYGKQPKEIAAMGCFCQTHAVQPPPRRDGPNVL